MHHEQVLGLQAQLKEMSAHLEGLEKERDFYFAKVRVFALCFLFPLFPLRCQSIFGLLWFALVFVLIPLSFVV